jgi:competence protein ComEA
LAYLNLQSLQYCPSVFGELTVTIIQENLPMNEPWLDRNRNIIFILLSLLAIGGATVFYLQQPAEAPIEIIPVETVALITTTPSPSPTPSPVRIYITGAIANSDVYFLPQGSIIKDAILSAGGFTPDADRERINQALELQDQQHIHIPRIGEEDAPPPVQNGSSDVVMNSSNGATAATGNLINLNTATLEQLDSLPGIGPAIAQRIIDYRESFGGFTAIEEITQVSGIGEATLAKIKGSISVE